MMRQFFRHRLSGGRIGAVGQAFAMHGHIVHAVGTGIQLDLEMRGEARDLQKLLLDLGREDVHAAQNDHVVAAPGDLFHPPHRPRGARQQPGQVAGAITDHRQTFLGQRGEDQLAHLAIGQNLAGFGVNDLGVEVIFPDMQAVLRLDAFIGDAGAHHFRQAVNVDGVHVEDLLDLLAHLVGPGLGPEDADLKRAFARVHAPAAVFVQDRQHVRRRDHDDARLEILDQCHLPFGHPARDRHHGAAQTFGTVMRAKPPGEQSIAVGHMADVARTPARGPDGPRNQVRPIVDIALGIADHGRLAGRAGRGMDADQLLARDGEHAEGIVVAQILLVGEGELRQISQRMQVFGMHARLVETLAVEGRVLIGVLQRPLHAVELQGRDFIARGDLDRVQRFPVRRQVFHGCVSSTA